MDLTRLRIYEGDRGEETRLGRGFGISSNSVTVSAVVSATILSSIAALSCCFMNSCGARRSASLCRKTTAAELGQLRNIYLELCNEPLVGRHPARQGSDVTHRLGTQRS